MNDEKNQANADSPQPKPNNVGEVEVVEVEVLQGLDCREVRGADAHTLNEHIIVDSLAERGRLMAGLLATLE